MLDAFAVLLRSLLLNVCLGTPLQRLALVVNALVLLLLIAVARHIRYHATDGALHAVAHALAQVRDLALSFLGLALLVLLLAGLLETLMANEPAESLFG